LNSLFAFNLSHFFFSAILVGHLRRKAEAVGIQTARGEVMMQQDIYNTGSTRQFIDIKIRVWDLDRLEAFLHQLVPASPEPAVPVVPDTAVPEVPDTAVPAE
jgi:hypothetical protein